MNEKQNNSYYGTKTIVFDYDGVINYNPEELKRVVGAERISYDEFLEIQKRTAKDARLGFAKCYHNEALGFKGQIEKRNPKKIYFKRIYVDGMNLDGTCFEGKEDHVWMDCKGFEGYDIGDCLSFFAEVYCYIKTGDGKAIDYGLRNPEEIKRIDAYELPSDKDLLRQEMEQLMCDNCYLNENCNRTYCMLQKEKRQAKPERKTNDIKGK